MTVDEEKPAVVAQAIVLRFFSDATIRVVPAGHVQRFQVVATQGGVPRKLSSHLGVSEDAAWAQAARQVREMFRELFRPDAADFVRREMRRAKR